MRPTARILFLITLQRSAFSRSVGLPDAEHVRIVLDHRRLVVIDIEVIRCREMSHDARESRFAALTVHAVPICNSNQPKHQDVGRRIRRTRNPVPHARERWTTGDCARESRTRPYRCNKRSSRARGLPAETEGVHHRRAGPVCAFPQ